MYLFPNAQHDIFLIFRLHSVKKLKKSCFHVLNCNMQMLNMDISLIYYICMYCRTKGNISVTGEVWWVEVSNGKNLLTIIPGSVPSNIGILLLQKCAHPASCTMHNVIQLWLPPFLQAKHQHFSGLGHLWLLQGE